MDGTHSEFGATVNYAEDIDTADSGGRESRARMAVGGCNVAYEGCGW